MTSDQQAYQDLVHKYGEATAEKAWNDAKNRVLTERLTALYEVDEVKPVFTPFLTLGKEMIDRLPSVSGSILVLSDAGLLVAVLRRLKAEGRNFTKVQFIAHTEQVHTFVQGLGVASRLIGYNKLQDWFKEAEMGLKFDIVVGNPPYQGADGSSDKLWKPITVGCFSSLSDGGYLALITPASWGKPLSNAASKLNRDIASVFFGNSRLWTNMNVNEFFNVGVQISAFIVKKDGIVAARDWEVVDKEVESIASKIIGDTDLTRFVDADKTVWKRHPDSKEKTDSFCVPILGKNKVTFSNRDDAWLRSKIKAVIPRVLGYSPQYDEKGEFGFNFNSHAWLCTSHDELLAVKSLLESKVVRFAIKRISWTPQTDFPLLKRLRLPTPHKVFTDQELYAHFNLTQDEIDLIEATVK